MKQVVTEIHGISPYSQSKFVQEPKLEKESPDDYEKRTWQHRMHQENGEVFIPPMAMKLTVEEAARFLSIGIPGKGKATWTKHFVAGVMVMEPIFLGIRADDVRGEWLFVPSDGRRGGPRRVQKCFPIIREWNATVHYYILDDTITQDVFQYHLEQAGQFIGIGRFRPRNGGYYGRFRVDSITWEDDR